MKTIRASEIGSFSYCQRAWWYQQHGYSNQNQVEMLDGTDLHAVHGRRAFLAGMLHKLAVALLILAGSVLTIWLIGQMI